MQSQDGLGKGVKKGKRRAGKEEGKGGEGRRRKEEKDIKVFLRIVEDLVSRMTGASPCTARRYASYPP